MQTQSKLCLECMMFGTGWSTGVCVLSLYSLIGVLFVQVRPLTLRVIRLQSADWAEQSVEGA